MTDQHPATKEKIMETARILFADHGFEGTSIREIARSAEVNIASVNYHFTNKENLFIEILKLGYSECAREVRNFQERENPSLEDLLVHLLKYFREKSHDLISFFKMRMSTQHCHQLGDEADEQMGPPGSRSIAEIILKEVGGPISEEDLTWAVRSLFGHVIHQSIIYSCSSRANSAPFHTFEDMEKGVRRLAKLVLQDLKTPHGASNR